MKKLLLLSLILITQLSQAQTFQTMPTIDGKVGYEKIVTADGSTKSILFNTANRWMLENADDVKKKVLSTNSEQGQILGKGFLSYNNYKYGFDIIIDCKDGKYRIRLKNMVIIYGHTTVPLEVYNDELRSSTNVKERLIGWNLSDKFNDVVSSLVTAMKKPAVDDF